MKCPECAFDSPPGMKFCGQCGAKLGSLCPQCGTENPPGFKFCGECGASLSAPAAATPPRPAESVQSYTPPHLAGQILQTKAALEGERKQVTVLFCDLVGSTALADRLGPEIMHLLLNRFFEIALGEVHRYGGTVNQFLGDGFMALFGAPISHEDHARRAVLAAVGLRKLLEEHRAELGEQYGIALDIRMGLNTGWVVVGGIGDHLRQDYTAIGDTTNLAARLQQLAEPGTILVSEGTCRSLQGAVQLEALEPLRVKGKEEPIPAFRVLGAAAPFSEDAVLESAALSPFVGRQRELEILEELRERAADGAGQVVGIAGEAGAGKSRLLFELRHKPSALPAASLLGRCLSYGAGVPYLPLLYLLRSEWGIGESDEPSTVTAKVQSGLEKSGMDAEGSMPYLLRLLGTRGAADHLSELSPQALQARTFTVLRQVILGAGQGRLVLLEIEDLHWIDETSEDFLAFLVDGMPAARLLLLATHRPGYRPRWIEKSYATQINLRRLTLQECQAIVESQLRDASLPAERIADILGKADGNPFFVEELTHSLLERPDVSIPDTIQGVLMARVDRLPEEPKRLLQTASVLGREFSLALLGAVWGSPGLLGSLLSELRRWEFLYEEPAAEEPLYFFKHALTQETVYQSLLTNRRRSLHAAAGKAFEELHAGRLEEVYDQLAYHYSEADDPRKAVLYLSLFAGKAARGYAHTEAARALQDALAHAGRLPAPERDRQEVSLILQLAPSLLPLARFSETLEIFLGHGETLERIGDPALAGPYFFWLAHTYSYIGDQDAAAANAWRAIAAAREAGDLDTEGRAFYVLCRDAFWSGRFLEGIGHGQQAIALLEGIADRWWQGQAYWVLGFHHYVLGHFEEALNAMGETYAIWKALQDPRLDPSWSTGYFHASVGDWERGIEECKGGLARAQDPLNTAAALGYLGYAYLEKGDLTPAVEALETSVARLRGTGMQQLLGWFSAFLAEAYLLSGRSDEALELSSLALAATEDANFRYGAGLALRARGRIELAGGDPASITEAEAWFERARESFREIGAPFEVARTRLDLAGAAHARGDSDEAANQLGLAYNVFVELRVPKYVGRTERIAREMAISLTATSPAG